MGSLLPYVSIFAFVHASNVNYCNVYDLTWPVNNNTVCWADFRRFEYTKQFTQESSNGDWIAANEFAIAEHCGTHIDAPYHFKKRGWKLNEIPITRLYVRAIKIDVSEETSRLGYNARLLPKHLVNWERRYGKIPKNSVMLVYFNWGKYYHDRISYLGGDTVDQFKFPGISKEAGEWIVNHTSLVGIGVDVASIDIHDYTDNHKAFVGKSMFNLENVKIPASLPAKIYRLAVLPMNLEGGTGGPVRILAFTDDNDKSLVECNS
ncbi:hypothetical protein FQA39_LY03251 [Lamprigera yunnana]|nr:hypothetical protein FQA39_LY03251 [Lamprigera yunnana]